MGLKNNKNNTNINKKEAKKIQPRKSTKQNVLRSGIISYLYDFNKIFLVPLCLRIGLNDILSVDGSISVHVKK